MAHSIDKREIISGSGSTFLTMLHIETFSGVYMKIINSFFVREAI